MKLKLFACSALFFFPIIVNAQKKTFSLGTRAVTSIFSDDGSVGKGLGGQFRYQFADHLNSEWYADFITSQQDRYTYKNDYHIGWSLMFYPRNNFQFNNLLQPYLIAGHCFDYSKVAEQNNPLNYADRLSMAVQAGAGSHINVTKRFDFSLTLQYMLHLGKHIETEVNKDVVTIEKSSFSSVDGHTLCALSINYKL